MSFNDYIYWQTLQKTGKTPEEIYEYEHPKVVRCKECKYWHKNRKEGDGMNVFDVCYDFQADDFCSYGERKESE